MSVCENSKKIKTIWKYPVQTEMTLPGDHTILKFGFQGNTLMLWAIVDPGSKGRTVEFQIMPTGAGFETDDLLQQYAYIDTVFHPEGTVWHIFSKDGFS